VLEEYIAVLGHAAAHGSLGRKAALAEAGESLAVEQRFELILLEHLDFLDFVGCAETVEEVYEGNRRFDGGQVGDAGKVHDFLNGAFAEHGEAGLTNGHHVLMVAEDAQGMRGECAGRNMENAGKLLARDFIHVGNHEQKALRSSVGGSERTGLKRTVNGTGCAAFRLHLLHENGFAENVLAACGSPFIHVFGHCGRRRDGIDGGHFAEHIRDMCGGLVAITG